MAWLALRLYSELRSPDEMSPLAVEGLFFEMMAETSRRSARCEKGAARKPPRWLEQAKDLIHAKFSETLSLTMIAESINIHPVHLAREFRRHYGCTIGEYIRRLRIEFACGEIASTNTPFFEIAADAGFADQGHFARIFKRQTGMTPTQYRASFRSR